MTKIHSGSTYEAMLDLLDIDGGWLTTSGLGVEFPGVQSDTIKRNIIRMRARGEIESRPRRLGYEGVPEQEHHITEFGRLRLRGAA